LQAEYRMNGEKGGHERQRDCEKLWRDCAKLCVYIDACGAQNSYCTPTLTPTSLSAKEITLDQTSVGRFSLLWAPAGPGSYIMLREPDRFSNLYICICLALWEPNRFWRFLFFTNTTASKIWWFLHI
jgi:hypothetical protein